MTDLIHELGFYAAKKKWPKGLEDMPDLLKRAAAAVSEAEERVKDTWRQALEDAAKTIEEGFDRGIASKHDLCAHKKFEWEDCESCAAEAVRALITSEPHDAEGRETPRRGDPSIFDDAEGRN